MVLMTFVQRDSRAPFAFAQRRLQFAQNRHARRHILYVPLLFQRARKAFQIAGGRVHVWLYDLHV